MKRLTFVLWLTMLGACSGPAPSPSLDAGTPPTPEVASFLQMCDTTPQYCDALYTCADSARRAQEQQLFGFTTRATCVKSLGFVVGAACKAWDSSLDAGRARLDLDRLVQCSAALASGSCETRLNATQNPPAACVGSPFVTGLVDAGSPCRWDAECATPTVCSRNDFTADGVCGAVPSRGEPCFGENRCGPGLRCTAGVCGDAVCTTDRDCAATEWCNQPGNDFEVEASSPVPTGLCEVRRPLGAMCDDVNACANSCGVPARPGCGYCDNTNGSMNGFRAPGLCATPRAAGGACDEPVDCLSGSCVSGACK